MKDLILKLNMEILSGKRKPSNNPITLNNEEIDFYINDKKITKEIIHKDNLIGVVNGLYATSMGYGGIIPIQIKPNYFPNGINEFHFKLTGCQGDVMKESVTCAFASAMGYLKTKYPFIINDVYNKFPLGFHIHTPSGGTPKDGPSAGCAFVLAFISVILNRKIKNDVAMTGEIDLQGNITQIGGLHYKLNGAKNAGVKLALITSENKDDIQQILKINNSLFSDQFNYKLIYSIDDLVENGLIND